MAFAARNLSVLSYANGFTLWHYSSPDAYAAITGANYFNTAADMLRKGDMIVLNAATGSTQANAVVFVGAVTNGVVTLDTSND